MNAPLWLMALPLLGALLLLPFRRFPLVTAPLSGAVLLAGGLLGFGAAGGTPIVLLGRSFFLSANATAWLSICEILLGGVAVCSYRRGQDAFSYVALLVGTALVVGTVASDSLAVAAMLLPCALIALGIMIPLERPDGWRHSLYALIISALLAPLLLIMATVLESQTVPPYDLGILRIASVAAGLAFAILLGVIPLHPWRLTYTTFGIAPLNIAFGVLIPVSTILVMSKFVQLSFWSSGWEVASPLLLYGGAATMCIGGFLGAVQRDMGDLIGYSGLTFLGGILMRMGLDAPGASRVAGIEMCLVMCALTSLALASQNLIQECGCDLAGLRGAMWRRPLEVLTIAGSGLVMVGFPGTAVFSGRIETFSRMAASTPGLTILAAAGGGAIILAYGRFLLESLRESPTDESIQPTFPLEFGSIVAALLLLALVAAGLFPSLLQRIPEILSTPALIS